MLIPTTAKHYREKPLLMDTLHFPPAKIPSSALLDITSYEAENKTVIPSILEIKNRIFTTSGRASIALALEHAGVSAGDEVLIPAYHCEAMVAPAKWRQAKIVFYRIKHDTKADIEDIAAKISTKTRAIIVTHYFGFEQDLKPIRQLCNQHKIILIEDCAHAMFGLSSGQPIGSTGDYAIGSCMKFLPIYEGGMLLSTTRNINNIKLSSPSLKFQLKSAFNALESSIYFGRLGRLGSAAKILLKIKDVLWGRLKRTQMMNDGSKVGPSSSEGGFGLDEDWIYKKISYFSHWVINHSSLQHVIEQRRHNYQRMYKVLSKLPNCRVMFENLPEHTVPWVFPIYVDQAERYFVPLKMQEVPVWRFGEFLDPEVTIDVCPISVEYSKHIFQLPCHQSLTKTDIDWMLETITRIFTEQQ